LGHVGPAVSLHSSRDVIWRKAHKSQHTGSRGTQDRKYFGCVSPKMRNILDFDRTVSCRIFVTSARLLCAHRPLDAFTPALLTVFLAAHRRTQYFWMCESSLDQNRLDSTASIIIFWIRQSTSRDANLDLIGHGGPVHARPLPQWGRQSALNDIWCYAE
jgi:hypothetical protein